MKVNFLTYKTALAAFLKKPKADRYEWLFIISLSVALTVLLHANALNGYWRFDDGAHLMFATEYSPWQYFFDPAITRVHSGASVAPWNIFFYDLNLSIFGFEPCGFYFHLLLLIVGNTLALYTLLRLWLPLPSAALGIIIFLTGKPTYHLTQALMTGHYLTGMLFSLLSLICFTHYLRHGNRLKLLSAVVLYALAMTCKEVYVPLIALCCVLPAGNYKQRITAIIPFAVVAIGYALWRHKVLGAWIGGYITNPGEANILTVLQQFANIPALLFDGQGWGLAALIIITILSLLAAWNRQLNISLIATTVFILLAPLLPLTLYPGIHHADRYLFALWVAVSIWIASIFQSPKNTTHSQLFWQAKMTVKSLSALVLVIASFLGHINERQQNKDSIHKAEEIYRFALAADFSKKALILDAQYNGIYWAFVSSEGRRAYDMSKNLAPQPVLITVNTLNGLLVLDKITQDTQLDLSATTFYQYHQGQFSRYNIKPLISSTLGLLKAGKDQLVKVTLRHENDVLSWDFQPKGINYSIMLWKARPNRLQYSLMDLPDQGSYPLSINGEIQISVSFKSPAGWIAVSPNFKFEPEQAKRLWAGKTDLSLATNKLESLLFRFGL